MLRIYGTAEGRRDLHQHGWAQPGAGQYLCGAVVTEREVRGGLLTGLRRLGGGLERVAAVFYVL
jgi:hypothetical protein